MGFLSPHKSRDDLVKTKTSISLIKNTTARSLAELFNRIGSAVFWVMIARMLGVQALGSLAFALSLLTIVMTIPKLGLGTVFIRDISQRRGKENLLFGNMLIFGFSASLFAILVMNLVLRFLSVDDASREIVMILSCAIPFICGFYWSQSVLWAKERQGYIALARLAENSIKVGVGIAFLLMGHGIVSLAVLIVASKSVSFFLCYLFASRFIQPRFTLRTAIFRRYFSRVPVFALISLFYDGFMASPVIFVAHFSGEAAAGLFSAAFKLVDILVFITHAYGQALYPVLSRLRDKYAQFSLLLTKSLKYMLLFTLGIASGGYLLAGEIIFMIYGPSMAQAVPVFEIIIWSLVPFGCIPILAFSLISHHLEKYDCIANMAGFFVLAALMLIYLPVHGMISAAWAFIISTVLFFVIEFIFVSKFIHTFRASLVMLIPLFGLAGMAGMIKLANGLDLFLTIGMAALFYIFFLYITRMLTDLYLIFPKRKGVLCAKEQ